jgi:hypothetical protein
MNQVERIEGESQRAILDAWRIRVRVNGKSFEEMGR